MKKGFKKFTGMMAACMLFAQPVSALAADTENTASASRQVTTAADIVQQSAQRLVEQASFRGLGTMEYSVHMTQADNNRISSSDMDMFEMTMDMDMEFETWMDFDARQIHQTVVTTVFGEEMVVDTRINSDGIFMRDNFTNSWVILSEFEDTELADLLFSTDVTSFISPEQLARLGNVLRLSEGVDEDGNRFYRIAGNFNERILMEISQDGATPEMIEALLSLGAADLNELLDDMRMNIAYVDYIDAETLLPIRSELQMDIIMVVEEYGERIRVSMSGNGTMEYDGFGESFDFPAMPRTINELGRIG